MSPPLDNNAAEATAQGVLATSLAARALALQRDCAKAGLLARLVVEQRSSGEFIFLSCRPAVVRATAGATAAASGAAATAAATGAAASHRRPKRQPNERRREKNRERKRRAAAAKAAAKTAAGTAATAAVKMAVATPAPPVVEAAAVYGGSPRARLRDTVPFSAEKII